MRKCLYLPLLGAIVLFGAMPTQAQIALSPDAQSGVVIDSSVDRIAYLEDKIANMESVLETSTAADTCTSSCRRAGCDCPGLIGGYDFVLFAPHFSNAISYQLREIVAPVTVVNSYGYPTEYNIAPRFWLGYQGGNGLGVRLRYMQYDEQLLAATLDSADPTITLFFDGLSATNGQVMSFATGMELDVLDLDITQDFDVWCAKLTAGAGVRYAKLRYDYSAAVSSSLGELQFVSAGESSFEGAGPTAFIDFKAPIRRSGLSVVGGLRGSILFGQGRDIDVVSRIVAPVSLSSSIEIAERSTGVLEGSLGLQYDRPLTQGTDAFVRCAWEGQLWMDVGSPVQSDGDMTLQGLSVAFGVTR